DGEGPRVSRKAAQVAPGIEPAKGHRGALLLGYFAQESRPRLAFSLRPKAGRQLRAIAPKRAQKWRLLFASQQKLGQPRGVFRLEVPPVGRAEQPNGSGNARGETGPPQGDRLGDHIRASLHSGGEGQEAAAAHHPQGLRPGKLSKPPVTRVDLLLFEGARPHRG